MPRPRKTIPSYLRHHSGRGRMVGTDQSGTWRYLLLPGEFNSPESLEAFARLQLEISTSPAPVLAVRDHGPTVAEVFLPYVRFATGYCGKGSELEGIKSALKVVRQYYGMSPAAEFGPLALKAVREAFIIKGWSRQYCNRQTRKIIQAFKWAASEELVPASVFHALKTVAPLREGKTTAPEAPPRMPAIPADVQATLPFLRPHVRALVEVIRATGMRPSEACRMTLVEIDRSGEIWVYRPGKHKTKGKGKLRAVALGTSAQGIILTHLGGKVLEPDEPLFSPYRQREEWFQQRRAARKTKVQPSQVCRKKAAPIKIPGKRFTPSAVSRAVSDACEKAKVKPWTPYQLRHLKGAELREQFSLEHVRAALGHSHASMSAHYSSGADATLAAEVAKKTG